MHTYGALTAGEGLLMPQRGNVRRVHWHLKVSGAWASAQEVIEDLVLPAPPHL